jgi:hypothetical protein
MRKYYPHYDINVRDNSLEFLEEELIMPLFRPVYTLKCERGQIGIPTFCPNKAFATYAFGEETFNPNNKDYACRGAAFMNQTFPYCGAYIIRVGKETAVTDDDTRAPLVKAHNVIVATVDTASKTWTWSTRTYENTAEVADKFANQFELGDLPNSPVPVYATPAEVNRADPLAHAHVSADATSQDCLVQPFKSTPSTVSSKSLSFNLGHNEDYLTLYTAVTPEEEPSDFYFSAVQSARIALIGLRDYGQLLSVNVTKTFVEYPGGSSGGSEETVTEMVPAAGGSIVLINGVPNLVVNIPGPHSDVLYFTITANFKNSINHLEVVYDFNSDGEFGGALYTAPAVVTAADTATYEIPFMAFEAKDPGAYGNQYGFDISVDADSENMQDINAVKNVLYTLGFVHRKNAATTTRKVLTKYANHKFNFMLDSEMLDPTTGATVGLDAVMDRYWGEEYPTPIKPVLFERNIRFMIELLKGLASANTAITAILDDRPYSVNLFNLTTRTLNNYVDTELDVADELGVSVLYSAESEFLTDGINVMLGAGTDGYLNVNGAALDNHPVIEQAIRDVWELETNPEIQDNARYPFNMVIDTGYDLATKLAMIGVLGWRKDVKPVLTTWVGNTAPADIANTIVAAEASLVLTIRSYPESMIYNTGAYQSCIFGQVGKATNPYVYNKQLPTTFWYVDKLARLHNSTHIAGHPNAKQAKVESMKDIVWAPYTDMQKKNLWNARVNYCQYFSETGLHFPGLCSVYEYEASLFTDDQFGNTVLYLKQLLPAVWADYAGTDDPDEVVYPAALSDLNAKCTHMLGGKTAFATRMYQTASERKAGFEHHIAIDLFDNQGHRIWHYDIIANRNQSTAA